MESLNLRIDNWQGSEIEEISYSMSLKVPPKDELLRLLPTHLENLKYSWKFRTGILSTIDHTLKLCLYREYHEPKVGIFTSILPEALHGNVIEVRGIDITYVSVEPHSLTVEDSLSSKADPPKPLEIPGMQFWQSTCGWPDNISILFLAFHVVKRKPPRIVNEDLDQLLSIVMPHNGKIDTKPYFLSSDCSDVVVQCGSLQFPAHRLILSNRSKYFAMMLSSSMKESREGVIKIEDMEPQAIKELLRFIYQGEIENIGDHESKDKDNSQRNTNAKDLFIAADKYGMDDLKGICERHLLDLLCVENAMEIYDLCQMHGSPLLLRKAKEIIIWNKGKFIQDPETFKEFTCKYPELMFELFQFQS